MHTCKRKFSNDLYKSNKLLLSDCAGNVFILNQDRSLNSETQLQHLLTVSNENEKYNFIYGKIFKIIILLTATMDVYIYDVRKDVSTLKQTLILEPKSQDGQFMSSDKLFITLNEKLPLLVVTTLINIYCICWNDRKQEWNYIAKLNLYDLNNLMLPGPEFIITQGGITACNWNPNQSSELLIGTGLGALLSYKILQWRYIYPQYNHLTISYIPYGIFLITNEPLGMSNNNNNQKQQQYTLLLRRTTIRPDQPQDLIILFYPPGVSQNSPPNFIILCLANGKRMCVTNLIDKTSVIIDLKVTILQKCKNLFVSAPSANKLLSKNNNTIEGLPKFNLKYHFLLLNNDLSAVLRNRIGNSQVKSVKQDATTSHYHFLILAASKSQKIDVNRPHPRCQIIAFKTDLYFMNTFDFIPESSYIHSCYGDDNNNNNFSPPNFFNRQRPNSNLKIVVLNQRNVEKESLDAEGNDVVPSSLPIRIGYIDGNVINIVDVLLYPPYHETSNMDPKEKVASYKHSEDSINSLEMSPITANHVSFMDNRRNFYLWALLNPTSASSESSRQPSVIKLCTNLGKNLYRWFVWPGTNNFTALIFASELSDNNIPNNSTDTRKSFNLSVLYQTEPSTSEKPPFQKFQMIVQGKPYDLVYSGSSGLLHLITKTTNKEYFNLYELKFPWPPPQTAHSKSDEKRHRQKTDNIGTNKVLNCQLIDALNDGERMNDVYDIVTEHFDVAQTAILSLNLFNNVEERGDEKSPFPPVFVQLLKSLDGDLEFDDLKHLPYYPMNYSIKADGTKKKIKLLSKRSPILRLLKDLLTGNLGDLDKILTVAAVSGEPEATFLENIKALILTYTKLDLWQDALVLYKKHQSHLSLLPRGTKPILRDGENEKEEDEGISTHNLSYEFLCQGYVDWLKVTRQYSRLANFSFKELHDPKQALKYYVKAGDIQKCEEMLENLDHYEDVESQIGTDLIKELIEDLIKAEHYRLAADIFLKLPIDVASDLLMEEKSGHHTTDNEVNVTPLVKSSKNSKTPVARNNKFKKLNSSLKPVGKLNNILGVKERILNLYKAGNAYPQALTIAKEYFPGRVTELEECWGDYFVALATKHKTIKTPPFNYPDTKDELLNLLLVSQSSELPNNNNTLLPNLDRVLV